MFVDINSQRLLSGDFNFTHAALFIHDVYRLQFLERGIAKKEGAAVSERKL